MSPSVGDINAIGMAPAGNSNGGCVSEHKFGFSDIHSVNSSMSESGGVAMSQSISLKYKSVTEVMKFTANLKVNIKTLDKQSVDKQWKLKRYSGSTLVLPLEVFSIGHNMTSDK